MGSPGPATFPGFISEADIKGDVSASAAAAPSVEVPAAPTRRRTDQPTAPPADAVSPSEALWQLLDNPFRPVDATRALFGLSPAAARHVLGRELLNSSEAAVLLDSAPDLIRQLKNQLNFSEVRSVGAVVGPIQWHPTIMARAAAGFPEDLFVCAAPYRDFDLPENQLLLGCLKQLADSGRMVTAFARDSFDDDRIIDAREQARRAKALAEYRTFSGVRPSMTAGTIRKAVKASKRRDMSAVTHFLARSKRPLSSHAITHLADRRTTLQHKVLLAVLATLRRGEVGIRPIVPHDGLLTAGPLVYRHPGARGVAGAHGIRVGDLLIDVPEAHADRETSQRRLGQRSGSLTPLVVQSITEVTEASEQILAAARQPD